MPKPVTVHRGKLSRVSCRAVSCRAPTNAANVEFCSDPRGTEHKVSASETLKLDAWNSERVEFQREKVTSENRFLSGTVARYGGYVSR